MKIKIVSFASFIVFVFSFLVWSPNISLAADTPTFGGGAGTIASPFQISTCEQLQNIDYYSATSESYPYLDSYFILTDDIDCSDTVNWNDGLGFNPIGNSPYDDYEGGWYPFIGSFNGQGYTISNLYINRPNDENNTAVGLFAIVDGYSSGPGEIKNVNLVDVDITGGIAVGGLVGYSSNNEISHISVIGNIIGNTTFSEEANYYGAGGLIGAGRNVEIYNTYTQGTVQGGGAAGGLVGVYQDSYSIHNSYSNMEVQAIGSAGGLVGAGFYVSIYNSFAVGTVNGGVHAGGLVGYFYGDPDSYIHDSGWYVYPGAYNVAGVNYGENSTWDPSYREYDKSAFYSQNHGVYGYNNYETWDFTTPIWYAQGNDFPKFTEGESMFDGGDGLTTETAFEISTCQQLQNVKYKARDGYYSESDGYYYKLTDYIDCSETESWNDGLGFDPIGYGVGGIRVKKAGPDNIPFYGYFDGDGYVISNLYINRPADINNLSVGLFGYVSGDFGDGATITNVGLEDVDITGNVNVGGLVGYTEYSTISKSYVTGNVSGNVDPNSEDFYNENTGGLVGCNVGGYIENTYTVSNVSGGYNIGGLIGYIDSLSPIINSYSDSNVTGKQNIGGLVGYDSYHYIFNSFAVGTVNYSGPVGGEYYIGGLIGYLNGDSGTQYIINSNSGWASYPGSQNIDGIGYYNTNDSQPFSSPGKMFFFNKNSPTFDSSNNTGYRWDFYPESGDGTPAVWYEQGGALPKFTEPDEPMFAGGTGAEGDPFQIETCQQLQNIKYRDVDSYLFGHSTYYYELIDNIDCGETEDWNDGAGFDPIGHLVYQEPGMSWYDAPFTGSFDGQGFVISGLHIDGTKAQATVDPKGQGAFGAGVEAGIGLFGYVNDATITNVGLEDVDIIGTFDFSTVEQPKSVNMYVGGLVGYADDAQITHSYVTGNITESYNDPLNILRNMVSVGGLVGYNTGHIEDTYAEVDVTGVNYVGGLVGLSIGPSTIVNSYSNGNIIGDGYSYIGGLVGYNDYDHIYNSYAVGTVNYSGPVGGEYYIGGLIGYLNGDSETQYIFNSYWNNGYPDSQYIYGIGDYNTDDSQPPSIPSKEFFYYKYNPIYDYENNTGYAWDFYGFEGDSIWYEQGGDLPKFTEYDFFAGGSGLSWDDPFQITTCQELQNVKYKLADGSYYFKVMNDIDCSETEDWNNGQGFDPIGFRQGMDESPSDMPFYGDFNGNNKIISNLYINRPLPEGGVMEGFNMGTGLFGFVDGYDEETYIYNVRLEDVDITGAFSVGGLVGYNLGAEIYHSYVAGDVNGNVNNYNQELNNFATGGLVGYNDQGHIEDTYMTGTVSGSFQVGGLVGSTDGDGCGNFYCTIANSYTDADVTGDYYVGGLVGFDNMDNIYNSFAVGTIHKTGSFGYMGGLVGYFSGDGASYEDYIYNSGWYNYFYPFSEGPFGGSVGAIGYDSYYNSTNDDTEYTEFSKQAFYSMYHQVYQGGSWGSWDFSGGGEYSESPTWYEQLDDLPKFEADSDFDDMFAGGSGIVEDPFEIASCQQLQNIGRMPSGNYYYKLTDDIDCGETENWNNGQGFNPIGNYTLPFSGYFDGDKHIISNLHIYRLTSSNEFASGVGLFGFTTEATIIDVGLENVDIGGIGFVGGLVGNNDHGSVIINSYITGDVQGYREKDSVGGLVGFNYGHIENTYATGTVTNGGVVGGLVGGTAVDCEEYSCTYDSTIVNSYSNSIVSGGNYVGGLVGYDDMDHIYNSYAVGTVSDGGYVGGLVGYIDSGDENPYTAYILNSGWYKYDPDIHGVGYDYLTDTYGEVTYGVTDNTVFYSKTHNIYDTNGEEGVWDFENVWYENTNGYPRLTGINTENVSPTVSAGSDKSITLPTSSATLTGTATDIDGSIEVIFWEKISGPSTYTIVNPNSLSTDITDLTTAGTYIFRLSATDDEDATSTDTVSVTVRNRNAGGGGSGGGTSSTSLATGSTDNCLPGDLFDKVTGATCPVVTTPSITNNNCLPGYLFDPTTGLACPQTVSTPSNTSGQESSPQATFTFTRTLKEGMTGEDVRQLQIYLNTHGYILATEGAGSPGFESTYFGERTKQAVIKFQIANGLEGDGVVGPLTRAKFK